MSLETNFNQRTNAYELVKTKYPMIQLVHNEGVRTQDRYGKVTIIIEDTISHQVVMLNLVIADIFNIATKEAYTCLSFPLGSTMNIPVKLQNENAH